MFDVGSSFGRRSPWSRDAQIKKRLNNEDSMFKTQVRDFEIEVPGSGDITLIFSWGDACGLRPNTTGRQGEKGEV